jgi:hypothetical protein
MVATSSFVAACGVPRIRILPTNKRRRSHWASAAGLVDKDKNRVRRSTLRKPDDAPVPARVAFPRIRFTRAMLQ